MKALIYPLVLVGTITSANAVAPVLPANAYALIPSLQKAVDMEWETMTIPSLFAAQIEQESCVSLKSKGCWNPHTELKTSREYGFGLGQITIAYDANGKQRFNNFTGSKKEFPQLSGWTWEDRYNPLYQIRTVVLMDKSLYNKVRWDVANEREHYAFILSAYNGGMSSVMKDRKLCEETDGCDPSKWFGHVEKYSFKSKIKIHGYGQSFYDINRGYVQNVINLRRTKYIPYMEGKTK
jgi:hypothetical protein